MDMKYSVLMSVYYRETPEFLRESLNSMLNQTAPPDQIVLVKDGPLSAALEAVVGEYQKFQCFDVVELKENVGLGKALNIGIKKCRNQIIARMDSDDISRLDRCEKQLNFLKQNRSVSIVGSTIGEFYENPKDIISYRVVPTNHKEIIKRAKFRNPMNHPSVMYKKEDVLRAGNYQDLFLNEDYYLWIRMIEKGSIFGNLMEPLVLMRISPGTYARRSGWNYFIAQKRLFEYMYENKYLTLAEYTWSLCMRFIMRIVMPHNLKKIVYSNLLRKKCLYPKL